MKKNFYEINKDILDHKEFNKLKNISHHGINRYDHCCRVAYYTYSVTKLLHLNYEEASRAALLHDFFLDEVENENNLDKLLKHPEYALINSKKYFEISKLQEDIIVSHMFPIGKKVPKYLESWIVDIIDDVMAISEKFLTFKNDFSSATTFLIIFILNYLKLI